MVDYPATAASISLEQVASTIAGFNPHALSVAQAQVFIERMVPRPDTMEKLALSAALGRVLARDVVSPINVPAYDNAAMDGYALRGVDLSATRAVSLRVVGTELAGQSESVLARRGECVRITTGAMMPPGLDTVVPQELARIDAGRLLVPARVVAIGDNCRRAGEDLARGKAALREGRHLRPADLGLLASMGQAVVPVRPLVRVAIFSTGNELRSIGRPLPPGCIYDSNRYTLKAMLQRIGVVETIDLGIVPDDPEALEDTFRRAAQLADVVITSGGVSVGEADHTKTVMAGIAEVQFWSLAIRPGRPMAVGRIATEDRDVVLFGLPGNPVAVMVAFYTFVRDALLAMSGAAMQPLPMLSATSSEPIRKKPGRTEYQRGIVTRDASGGWQVCLSGSQGSGILRSMSEANGLVVLDHARGDVAAGELLNVLPFDGLI